jgi:hypothetical protein
MKVVLQSGWPLQRFVFFILFSNDSFSKCWSAHVLYVLKHVPLHIHLESTLFIAWASPQLLCLAGLSDIGASSSIAC